MLLSLTGVAGAVMLLSLVAGAAVFESFFSVVEEALSLQATRAVAIANITKNFFIVLIRF